LNPERVRRLANPFRVNSEIELQIPGLSLRSNPGLELANAFGVSIANLLLPKNQDLSRL